MINRHYLIFFFLVISSLNLNAQQDAELYRTATDLYYQGQYVKALNYLDSALAMNDDDISRHFYRSKINEKLGKYQDAISDLTTCIDRSEHDAMYLTIRADYYERLEKLAPALADLTTCIKLRPSWNAYYRRGLIFIKQNQLQKGLMDLNQSIKMNDTQADPLRARGYLKHKMGNSEDACEDMLKVYDMGFDDVRDWIRRNCG